MKYAIVKISEAEKNGISSNNHLVKDGFMIVNEKEIIYSKIEGNNFEEKILNIKGEIYSNNSIKIKIKKDGYKL